ncbi:MAG: patatin-like phospholipase family protein [Dehalogenimonas sp.]
MKLGLALSGGSARGLAHVGVIEVLENNNIPIGVVSGTSMGAIIGAAYARGISAVELKAQALDTGWQKLAPLIELNPLQTSGLFGVRRIKRKLKDLIGDPDFTELEKPFACVATDIFTGEAVTLSSGKVVDAVLASMALPLIFKVPKMGRRYLVDGGITDPLPVGVCRNLGADKVIAVNVLKELVLPVPKRNHRTTGDLKPPNIFQVLSQVIYIASGHLAAVGLKEADVAIEPDMTGIHLADFNLASKAVTCGERAAEKALVDIKRLMADSD